MSIGSHPLRGLVPAVPRGIANVIFQKFAAILNDTGVKCKRAQQEIESRRLFKEDIGLEL